jgi:hypothetical protein
MMNKLMGAMILKRCLRWLIPDSVHERDLERRVLCKFFNTRHIFSPKFIIFVEGKFQENIWYSAACNQVSLKNQMSPGWTWPPFYLIIQPVQFTFL